LGVSLLVKAPQVWIRPRYGTAPAIPGLCFIVKTFTKQTSETSRNEFRRMLQLLFAQAVGMRTH
jgi:hypothetical protein